MTFSQTETGITKIIEKVVFGNPDGCREEEKQQILEEQWPLVERRALQRVRENAQKDSLESGIANAFNEAIKTSFHAHRQGSDSYIGKLGRTLRLSPYIVASQLTPNDFEVVERSMLSFVAAVMSSSERKDKLKLSIFNKVVEAVNDLSAHIRRYSTDLDENGNEGTRMVFISQRQAEAWISGILFICVNEHKDLVVKEYSIHLCKRAQGSCCQRRQSSCGTWPNRSSFIDSSSIA
ncbi:hypothetical protein BJ742DRAFT_547841 [Cladochytrium replicatum]|nr:hypothetical protein BJ742DRAFT_547841 [Cladochytrium replicatum]